MNKQILIFTLLDHKDSVRPAAMLPAVQPLQSLVQSIQPPVQSIQPLVQPCRKAVMRRCKLTKIREHLSALRTKYSTSALLLYLMTVLVQCLLIFAVIFWQPAGGIHALAVSDELLLRVRLEYKSDSEEAVLEDSCIDFASDGWIRSGNYLYYEKPLRSGSVVTLMKGFRVPENWGRKSAGAAFSIHVTAEILPYYAIEQQEIRNESAKVLLEEYEIISGKEVPYRNQKTVLPGQYVSKIVRIRVSGDRTPGVEVAGKDIAKQEKTVGVSGNDMKAPVAGQEIARKAITFDAGRMSCWLAMAILSLTCIVVSAIWMVKK